MKTKEERFWEKVDKTGECWLWTSATWGSGYGFFWVGGQKRSEFAHRLSWMWANNAAIPSGMVVMHSCDNKLCVNPSHLSVGTHADNTADRERKGRGAKGERNGGGKLKASSVLEILKLKRIVPRRIVAEQFGVHEGTVKAIWSRRTWKCLEVTN